VRAVLQMLGGMSLERTLEVETAARDRVAEGTGPPSIFVVEHDPVYTVGRAGVKRAYPRGDARRLPHVVADGTPVVEVDRGGDVTWHGPGQLVIHPVLPLKRLGVSLIGYIRALERCAIAALATLGVNAGCREGLTGTWVGDEKLGFIGIACRKWVTYHGMSVNVTCDLDAFSSIVPCGIPGCAVTSLARLVASPPSIEELGRALAEELCREVGLELSERPVVEEVTRG